MTLKNRRQHRRRRHRQRIAHYRLVDRENPLEVMPATDIYKRYRFRPDSVSFIVNLLVLFLQYETLRCRCIFKYISVFCLSCCSKCLSMPVSYLKDIHENAYWKSRWQRQSSVLFHSRCVTVSSFIFSKGRQYCDPCN